MPAGCHALTPLGLGMTQNSEEPQAGQSQLLVEGDCDLDMYAHGARLVASQPRSNRPLVVAFYL